MKKSIFIILCILFSIFSTLGVMEIDAAPKKTKWNYNKIIKKTSGAFTYHAITSKDNKKAWIYYIKINTRKKHTSMVIPSTIKGKKVTRIGCSYKMTPLEEGTYNIFGAYVEHYHGYYATGPGLKKIKTVRIPDTVETIQASTFSGLTSLREIKIPKKVKQLYWETFYGCKSLQTVYLPDGFEKLNNLAFEECPKLENVILSPQNKFYSINGKCIISRKNQALICALAGGEQLSIPEGTRKITTYALNNCTAQTVNIPASVTNIEKDAFSLPYSFDNMNIKNVTVSPKNQTYAKDGQCIYNIKDCSLAVAIINENGLLYISDKVHKLTDKYNVIGSDPNPEDEDFYEFEAVYFPETLSTVEDCSFEYLEDADRVYFFSALPPKLKNSSPPSFCDMYVPKGSLKLYKKWCKDDVYNTDWIDNWYTFDPEELKQELYEAGIITSNTDPQGGKSCTTQKGRKTTCRKLPGYSSPSFR